MNDENSYDYLYKMIMIGDSGVGKTNLLSRFVKDEFVQDSKTTIGVEFYVKQITLGNAVIKAQLWDTAGQERYRAITSAYYRGTKGVVLVYDITRRNSFNNLDKWMEEINENVPNRETVLLIIGNKSDIKTNREVTTQEGVTFAESHNASFMETSALDSTNVAKAFIELITEIHTRAVGPTEQNIESEKPVAQGVGVNKINIDLPEKKTKGDCKC